MRPLSPRRPPRRHDPAPSRLSYRARRAWRRPWVRRAVLRGGPVVALAAALALWLADGEELAAVEARWDALVERVEARPEFAVTGARIEGAGPELAAAIEEALPSLPSSKLSLDLDALQATLAAMPAVAGAETRVARDGVLLVRVEERRPVAVWRSARGLHALDGEGRALRGLPDRAARPDLPLVAGEGADRAVPEALALHAVAGPLGEDLRGLVRMGERRWDAVLDDGLRIMLPQKGAVAALERAAALEAAEDLTGRAVTHLDLRDPTRPVVRLARTAEAEMARVLAEERAGPDDTEADE